MQIPASATLFESKCIHLTFNTIKLVHNFVKKGVCQTTRKFKSSLHMLKWSDNSYLRTWSLWPLEPSLSPERRLWPPHDAKLRSQNWLRSSSHHANLRIQRRRCCCFLHDTDLWVKSLLQRFLCDPNVSVQVWVRSSHHTNLRIKNVGVRAFMEIVKVFLLIYQVWFCWSLMW